MNLVGTFSGDLGFGVTDLYLGSLVPVVFQRTYLSSRSEDIGLGRGWSFVFADRVNVQDGVATLTDAQGTRTLTNFDLTDTTIIEHTATTRTYTKIGDTYYLTQVSGPMGINIVISHDDAGRVLRVANDPGPSLSFDWTEKRLTAVSDSAGRRVSFDYDGARLSSVTDSAGAEWDYEYTNGLLRRATDPMDRVISRILYDRSGRVSAAGDSVGLTRYEYASGRTTVTDPLGAVTTYEHTDKGAIMAIADDEGRSVHIDYDAAGKAVQLSSSAGERATLSYDSQNRLVSQSVNGAVRAYSYGSDGRVSSIVDGNERATLDDRGQITSVQSTDPARSYTATYDAHGALTQLKSQRRNVAFEYDAQGNRTALTFSDLGRFTYERDTAGRVTRQHYPSGVSLSNEYDARGAFTKQSDNRGNAVTVQRDASGAPTAYIRADGKQMCAVRDDTGRVIRDTDFDGNVRTFAYNARGGLTDYTTQGRLRHFDYDHRGRLSAITVDGVTRKVERDEQGNIRRLSYSTSAKLRRAHALQDPPPPDPPPDCCPDPIITDIWAPYYPGGTSGTGGVHGPLLDGPTDGGTGGVAETRQQCIARHVLSCDLQFAACLLAATGVFIGVFAGCTLETLIAGAPVCEVIADIILALGAGGCVLIGISCINNAGDGCPP